MNCLFLLADNYPYSGACTSLLNNLFFKGDLLKSTGSIDVLACKGDLIFLPEMCVDGVTVHNCTLVSSVSVNNIKSAWIKHPIVATEGIIRKVFSKLDKKELKTQNVNSVYSGFNKLDAPKYDVVVAVMGSFEVAAAAIKYKRVNPINLLVYQVDPCSTNNVCPDSTEKERADFERDLYSIADGILTTPILLEEARLKYPKEIVDKMTSMEFPNVVPFEEECKGDLSKIRCVFAGSIYGDFRNPDYTLKLFDEVTPEVSFEMIGAIKPTVKETLYSHKVLYHGSMSLEETKSQIASADILVNIGNRMLNQVPSKLFEYISYGKPIINICKNRNCPTLPYLEKYPYALNLFEEDEIFEEQVSLLNDFILNNYKKRMPPDEIAKAFETCTPQYCAKQMLDVLKGICK